MLNRKEIINVYIYNTMSGGLSKGGGFKDFKDTANAIGSTGKFGVGIIKNATGTVLGLTNVFKRGVNALSGAADVASNQAIKLYGKRQARLLDSKEKYDKHWNKCKNYNIKQLGEKKEDYCKRKPKGETGSLKTKEGDDGEAVKPVKPVCSDNFVKKFEKWKEYRYDGKRAFCKYFANCKLHGPGNWYNRRNYCDEVEGIMNQAETSISGGKKKRSIRRKNNKKRSIRRKNNKKRSIRRKNNKKKTIRRKNNKKKTIRRKKSRTKRNQ